MIKLTFENISMMSHRYRSARKVRFHPQRNLIWGKNHTGKSSLIKTLFLTMGAKPKGDLLNWDNGTVSCVEFYIGTKKFKAIHQNGSRALFDAENDVIVSTTSEGDWNNGLAGVLGFNLMLSGDGEEIHKADSRCYFSPFYINQDANWLSTWNTFTAPKNRSCPMDAVLDYFSGIRPPEYYEAKSHRDVEHKKLEELKREHATLIKARKRLAEKIDYCGPKIKPEDFVDEIKRLTQDITALNSKQEILREKSVKGNALLESIKKQIIVSNGALANYEQDVSYLKAGKVDRYVCPICNAEHHDPFTDILFYAEDARTLKEAIILLETDLRNVYENLSKNEMKIVELNKDYTEISKLLETRRGDIVFGQVIESIGAEHAFNAFETERKNLEIALGDLSNKIYEYDAVMRGFFNRNKTKEIMEIFRNAYTYAMNELAIPGAIKSNQGMSRRPTLSGSGGPRLVLAYYYAIWSVCFGKHGAFRVPIVIDSPNQQGQDDVNLPKMLDFISDKMKPDTQLFLLTEAEVLSGFDHKIELDTPYGLLRSTEYEIIAKELDGLVDKMYENQKRQRNLFGDFDLNS